MTEHKRTERPSTVYFVGAGPGNPELITLKGHRLLSRADLVVYTGSLINPRLLDYCPKHCKCIDSAPLNLDEIVDKLIESAGNGETVVRMHTGDPSIYGAINEQMNQLAQQGIPYEVVPGVSSFCGAAASLKRQLTLPGATQTVILTRISGRTPVPASEELEKLAAHGTTLVIFLSTPYIHQVAQTLMKKLSPQTPATVVYKATWPDETLVRGTLETIASQVEALGITKTALIMVGQWLAPWEKNSRLYDSVFTHQFRNPEP